MRHGPVQSLIHDNWVRMDEYEYNKKNDGKSYELFSLSWLKGMRQQICSFSLKLFINVEYKIWYSTSELIDA